MSVQAHEEDTLWLSRSGAHASAQGEIYCLLFQAKHRCEHQNIRALEMIQRKAVRFIYSKYRMTDSPTNLMKEHGIQTLQARRKIERLKFLHHLKTNKLGINPDEYIQPLTARRTRHRHSVSLTPYSARTNVFKFSFFPRTISEWNDLPISAISCIDEIDHLES